jgi:hypothetical protein
MTTTATRPRLTPHQREVYARIVRQSRYNGHALAENVGSRGAVEHLVEKGYVRKVLAYTGPRGGEFHHLHPLVETEKWADTISRLEGTP